MQNKKTRELINVVHKSAELNVTLINWLKATVANEEGDGASFPTEDREAVKTKAKAVRDDVVSAIVCSGTYLDAAEKKAPAKARASKPATKSEKPRARAAASRGKAAAKVTGTTGKEPSDTLKAALYESLKRRSTGVGAKELSDELGINDRRAFLKLATWARETGVVRVEGSRRGTVYFLADAPLDKRRVNVNGLMVA